MMTSAAAAAAAAAAPAAAPAPAVDLPPQTIILAEVGDISVSNKHQLRQIYDISFSDEDTLRSVTAEVRELSKQHTLVVGQLEALQTYAKVRLDYLANTTGATLRNVKFDAKTWQFHAFADKGDGSTSEKLVVDVISTAEHQSVVDESNLFNQLIRKRNFLLHVYKVELERRLKAEGIKHVTSIELKSALLKSGFDFEAAFEYALDHIYTPLKKINIELQLCYSELRKAKSDLVRLDDITNEVPLVQLGDQNKSSRTIQTEIDALQQRIRALKEKGLLIVRLFRSKLEEQGACFTHKEVRLCIQRNNWNTDNASTELLQSVRK